MKHDANVQDKSMEKLSDLLALVNMLQYIAEELASYENEKCAELAYECRIGVLEQITRLNLSLKGIVGNGSSSEIARSPRKGRQSRLVR